MKKLIKLCLAILAFAGTAACNSEESLPVKTEQPTDYSITIDQARLDLLNIVDALNKPGSRSAFRTISDEYTLQLGKPQSRADEGLSTSVYVFNFSNDEGFAIMSSDKRLPALLAMADSGNLNNADSIDNPGLEIFMEQLDYYLYSMGGNGDNLPEPFKPSEPGDNLDPIGGGGGGDPLDYVFGDWVTDVAYPNGVCKVQWDQFGPYNIYCPIDSLTGKNLPAGCLPVALGQLLSVYNYPWSYKEFYFDWNRMTSQSSFYFPTETAQNIARLLQQLGTSENLNVKYEPGGSLSKMSAVAHTLKNLGFSSTGNYKGYDEGRVGKDLEKGYPVLISGVSHKNGDGGHAWLAHGIMKRYRNCKIMDKDSGKIYKEYTESYTYILCNWGWGGYHDGYYLSAAFDSTKSPQFSSDTPSSRSDASNEKDYNYQFLIKEITGIRK